MIVVRLVLQLKQIEIHAQGLSQRGVDAGSLSGGLHTSAVTLILD